MAKQLDFIWKIKVPDELVAGQVQDRIDEDGNVLEPGCLVKVDESGFFIHWTSDGREGQVIECSQISDIRSGVSLSKTSSSNGSNGCNGSDVVESRIVCICSGLDFVNVNYTYFHAKSAASAGSWCKNLRKITHNYKANNVCATTQLQKHWLKLCLMVNSSGKIPVRGITRTFASGKTERIVMQALEDLQLPGKKNDEIPTADFTFEKFIDLYRKICPRTDLDELFNEITHHRTYVSADQLMEFLNDKQRDPRLNEILCPFYDLDMVRSLIRRYEYDPEFLDKDWMSLDGFSRYLMSDENAPMFLDRLDIYQEMDHPLSHYYINSSHNTYLVGRQFGGKSSVEMYRQVLIAGCRCIELDCWDGPNSEPLITHGKAMCTDINFKDVILAIKETAFITSEYPLILSFENHCTKHQQYVLAKYCEEVFGDMLLKEALADAPLKPGVPLPSPIQMKRKILIKNKRLKSEVEHEQLERFFKGERSVVETIDTSSNVEGEDDVVRGDENANLAARTPSADVAHPEQQTTNHIVDMVASESRFLEMKEKHDAEREVKINMKMVGKQDSLTNEDESQIISNYEYVSATTNIHPYLSSLINYVQPVKFQGFEAAQDRNIAHNMSSFNENTGLGLLKNHAVEFVNYNKRQLSRIYPKGGRVESSNYMPQIFWNAGCQMVSLNFQTPDLAMQLNQGKFEYNGNCGYLLKPDFMRRPDREFDPFSECPVDGVIAAHCSVRVISAQFLSDRKVGTYVEVDMFGLPTDTIRKENKTRVVPNNGLNPVYNSEPFVFRKIVLPDLAVLRIGVYEESGKLIGQRILPLEGLQAGYRHISLRTEGNFPLSLPTVFCEIVLKTYIPDGMDEYVDALNNPRKFRSMADKRAQQMKSMGIDESDIEDVPDLNSKTKQSGNKDKNNADLVNSKSIPGMFPMPNQRTIKGNASSQKEAPVKYEAIPIETLRQSREFSKACKQHIKELAGLNKRHHKEKIVTQKAISSSTSAAAADSANRKSFKRKGTSASFLLCHRTQHCDSTTLPKSRSDSEVLTLVATPELERSPIWRSLLSKQLEEEGVLRKEQAERQARVLENLLTAKYHDTQCKELISKQDKEMKELSSTQTKVSLNTKKQFNNDKSIKSKAEADRRMKEINENNTKKFWSERQMLQSRHSDQLEKLKKFHASEITRIQQLCEEDKSQIAAGYTSEIVEKIETVI